MAPLQTIAPSVEQVPVVLLEDDEELPGLDPAEEEEEPVSAPELEPVPEEEL